ncbi:class I SAM-dependent methyltransferase [Streptomyces sp. NPDC006658]|uniref:class I SAM-dependent methyltransferase n=1 Tax=Streptomyces sp. NPDC006658 TaxID=3156900 RepID=UPI0033FDFDFC
MLGLDVSPVMVEPAARQVPGAGFRLAGTRGTALAEASFDAVCASFSPLRMSRAEPAAVIAQPARAVRRGGLVAQATVPLDVGRRRPLHGTAGAADQLRCAGFGGLVTGAGLTVPAEECARSTPDLPEAMPGPQLFPRARRPADR